ncbi:glutathione S-transferase [Vibrio tubiashii]|nr:glutathione S-transferase [Vibrio tubiashii]
MQLYLNETSPFSRVVISTALLSHTSSLTFRWVDPWSSPSNLIQANPFSLIPTLELDNGQALYESLCICQFLIESSHSQLLHQVNFKKADEVSKLGTAKTLMEIAFRSAALARFTDNDNELIERGRSGLSAALTLLDEDMKTFGLESYLTPNLATLYLHVALEYVQFRHAALYQATETQQIDKFLQTSPFKKVLELISIDNLSTKPSYAELESKLVD